MKAIISKYEIGFFFLLTILIGWLPFYSGKGSLFFFAPTLAAIIIALVAEGWRGVLDIFRRLITWRAKLIWYLIALLSPALLYLVAVAIHILLGGDAPAFPMFLENQTMLLMTFIFFLIPWMSSAFLEEVGFRGYALEKLQNRFGPMAGTLILGVFFGAWLLPEFYQPGSAQAAMGGISFYPWFILQEVGWSIMMTYVYNHTNKSSLIAGYLFHTAFNFWAFSLLTNAIPGEPLPAFDTRLFLISSMVVAVAGAITLITTKGQLGYKSD